MAQVAPEVTAREHAAARRLAASVGSSVVAGLRLLVVDDEPDVLELYTKLFTQQGAEVAVAANAGLDYLARRVQRRSLTQQ